MTVGLAPPLPTPRPRETACEMMERLPGEDRMRLEFRLLFRQLARLLEAEVRSGQLPKLSLDLWEHMEAAFAARVAAYCRAHEANAAYHERRSFQGELERCYDRIAELEGREPRRG